MNILISGGTGLVGSLLVSKLRQRGHHVKVLVRKENAKKDEYFWDYSQNILDDNALLGINIVIHLAGATIGKRWTPTYRKEIMSSRVDSAHFLLKKITEKNIRIKAFISASGINYYGTFTSEQLLKENDLPQHDDFLAEVCKQWEIAAHQFAPISDRVVCIRTAPVLSQKGGTFTTLQKLADFNLASGLGQGSQAFNWIHLDDLINIYIKAVEDVEMRGAYNAVASEIPTQKGFMQKLAKSKRKFFFPLNIPAFFLRLILGKMSDIILEGTKVSNHKIRSEGFQFHFPDVDSALENLVKQKG